MCLRCSIFVELNYKIYNLVCFECGPNHLLLRRLLIFFKSNRDLIFCDLNYLKNNFKRLNFLEILFIILFVLPIVFVLVLIYILFFILFYIYYVLIFFRRCYLKYYVKKNVKPLRYICRTTKIKNSVFLFMKTMFVNVPKQFAFYYFYIFLKIIKQKQKKTPNGIYSTINIIFILLIKFIIRLLIVFIFSYSFFIIKTSLYLVLTIKKCLKENHTSH